MNEKEHRLWDRLQGYIGAAPSVYRFLAFAIATALIFFFPQIYRSVIPPVALVAGVGAYTLFKALHPWRWHQPGILGYSLLGGDIAICIFLLISTGGLNSPFLLYTLAPVLTAALLLDSRVTFCIGMLSGAYVIGGELVYLESLRQFNYGEKSHPRHRDCFACRLNIQCLENLFPPY